MGRIRRALAAARQQWQKLQECSVGQSAAGCADATADPDSRSPVLLRLMRDARVWFGIACAAVVIAMLAWMIGLKDHKRTIDLSAVEVEADADVNDGTTAQVRADISGVSALNQKVALLEAQVDVLVSCVTRVDDTLTHLQAQIDAISASVNSTTIIKSEPITEFLVAHDAPAAVSEKENIPVLASDTTSDLAATEVSSAEQKSVTRAEDPHAPVGASSAAPDEGATEVSSAKQASLAPSGDRPWVINLATFSDKRDADRFVKRAQSSSVQVEQNQVTVKGKPYWRVQVTGFPSAAEAKADAPSIEAKLGLKGTWITRR